MLTIDVLRTVGRRWKLVLATTIIGAIIGGIAAILIPPTYTAHVLLYVAAQDDNSATAVYQGSLLSQQRVKSYTELVQSPRIAQDLKNRLGLPTSPESLTSDLSASSALDSVVIDLQANARTPDLAAAVANSAAESLVDLTAELERPSQPGAVPVVQVKVVQPALIPLSPSSAPPWALVVTGMSLAAIGALAVLLLSARIREAILTEASLEATAGVGALGTISLDTRQEVTCLAFDSNPQSLRFEEARRVRNGLRYFNLANQRLAIAVTSSLAGEGKTTLSLDLATALASSGMRVLLIDADLRRPMVAETLGLASDVGLSTVLAGRATLEGALQYCEPGSFHVLASGASPPNPNELVSSQRMRETVATATRDFEMVVIDTPPTLPVPDATSIATFADGVVFACKYDTTSSGQVASAVAAIRGVGGRIFGAALTMAPSTGEKRGYGPYQRSVLSSTDDLRQRATSPDAPTEETALGRPQPRPHPRSRM